MPFRDARTHFQDMLNGIALIDRFIGQMSYLQFCADQKTKSAVERQLQIITEAANRLGTMPTYFAPALTGRP